MKKEGVTILQTEIHRKGALQTRIHKNRATMEEMKREGHKQRERVRERERVIVCVCE